MSATLVQISVNPRGGVPKTRVESAHLGREGVAGDKQRNTQLHGGPERAVCLYALEIIEQLQSEGHPIDCGTTGENLMLRGLNWDEIAPGARLQIGDDIELEIVSYTAPCQNIAASFVDGEFKRISQKIHPGQSRVYARVLREGTAHEGDSVQILAPVKTGVCETKTAFAV